MFPPLEIHQKSYIKNDAPVYTKRWLLKELQFYHIPTIAGFRPEVDCIYDARTKNVRKINDALVSGGQNWALAAMLCMFLYVALDHEVPGGSKTCFGSRFWLRRRGEFVKHSPGTVVKLMFFHKTKAGAREMALADMSVSRETSSNWEPPCLRILGFGWFWMIFMIVGNSKEEHKYTPKMLHHASWQPEYAIFNGFSLIFNGFLWTLNNSQRICMDFEWFSMVFY